jgi:hypothetical protein
VEFPRESEHQQEIMSKVSLTAVFSDLGFSWSFLESQFTTATCQGHHVCDADADADCMPPLHLLLITDDRFVTHPTLCMGVDETHSSAKPINAHVSIRLIEEVND